MSTCHNMSCSIASLKCKEELKNKILGLPARMSTLKKSVRAYVATFSRSRESKEQRHCKEFPCTIAPFSTFDRLLPTFSAIWTICGKHLAKQKGGQSASQQRRRNSCPRHNIIPDLTFYNFFPVGFLGIPCHSRENTPKYPPNVSSIL